VRGASVAVFPRFPDPQLAGARIACARGSATRGATRGSSSQT